MRVWSLVCVCVCALLDKRIAAFCFFPLHFCLLVCDL